MVQVYHNRLLGPNAKYSATEKSVHHPARTRDVDEL
jgi:hypothetical protein